MSKFSRTVLFVCFVNVQTSVFMLMHCTQRVLTDCFMNCALFSLRVLM